MLISHLLPRHHKTPPPKFAPGIFMGLLAGFSILGLTKPIFGLVGLGTTLLVSGVLVEINRVRIWDDYRALYKKSRGFKGMWTKPNPVYYTINVVFLWPFIIFLGFISLWAAYMAS
jgi:hypothetical protein